MIFGVPCGDFADKPEHDACKTIHFHLRTG
jgi:hypothetical protein